MSIYAELTLYREIGYGQVRNIVDFGDHDPESPVYIDLTGVDPQPEVGWWYSQVDGTFSDVAPPETIPRRKVTYPEFWLQKFTDVERARVWAVCAKEDVPGVVIALTDLYRIVSFRDLTLGGIEIPLANPETEYVVDLLETSTVIGAGRADEILER